MLGKALEVVSGATKLVGNAQQSKMQKSQQQADITLAALNLKAQHAAAKNAAPAKNDKTVLYVVGGVLAVVLVAVVVIVIIKTRK